MAQLGRRSAAGAALLEASGASWADEGAPLLVYALLLGLLELRFGSLKDQARLRALKRRASREDAEGS